MSQSPLASAKPHALVVERNFGIQHFVRNMLRDVCDTDAAFSATIACAMLEERSYDLIIASVDVLGRGHGLDFLNAVKALPGAPPRCRPWIASFNHWTELATLPGYPQTNSRVPIWPFTPVATTYVKT